MLSNFDEFLLIFFFYNFVKMTIFNSIIELIWPTQIFNKKNNINFAIIKIRGFIETILKLRGNYYKYIMFFKSLYNYFLAGVKNRRKKKVKIAF